MCPEVELLRENPSSVDAADDRPCFLKLQGSLLQGQWAIIAKEGSCEVNYSDVTLADKDSKQCSGRITKK